MNTDSNFSHTSPKQKAAQVPISRRTGRYVVAYSYNGIDSLTVKEGIVNILNNRVSCKNMVKKRRHNT